MASSKDHNEMHEVVAECMIFANAAVAVKISETLPQVALLRHHPRPDLVKELEGVCTRKE